MKIHEQFPDLAPQTTDNPDEFVFIGSFLPDPNHGNRARMRITFKPEEHCALAINLGRQGKSKAYIAAAIGMSRSNIDVWTQRYPEFAQAMEISQALSQAWWEDAGQNGMIERSIDSSIWKHSIATRFPHDWRETSRVEQTGADGGALQIENKVSVVDQILTNLDVISKKTSETK